MDYRTLFFTYLAFLTVYAAFALLLALRNRKIRGFAWFAAANVIAFFKFGLQGLEGHIPTVFSALVANELYLVYFIFQMLGLRWFVSREPLSRRWPLWLTGALALIYIPLFFNHVPYIGNLLNVPILGILAATAWLMVKRGRGLFRTVAQFTAAFVVGQLLVSLYRAVLTDINYALPWHVAPGQHDMRWVYSLMAMMFFSTCVTLCGFWFFVVELQRELIQQSRTDALTGALNRRALALEAERELARANRSGRPICLLLLDLDDFKRINDTYGHLAGDLALQRMVNCINGMLRTQDLLARTGGEEFAVLLPDTECSQAQLVAERLRAAVERLSPGFGDASVRMSVSVGCAEVMPPCPSFETLLHQADTAMYTAKRSGKNRVIALDSVGERRLARALA
jgi:diguanylate cyclase (GGDEF)-like protein